MNLIEGRLTFDVHAAFTLGLLEGGATFAVRNRLRVEHHLEGTRNIRRELERRRYCNSVLEFEFPGVHCPLDTALRVALQAMKYGRRQRHRRTYRARLCSHHLKRLICKGRDRLSSGATLRTYEAARLTRGFIEARLGGGEGLLHLLATRLPHSWWGLRPSGTALGRFGGHWRRLRSHSRRLIQHVAPIPRRLLSCSGSRRPVEVPECWRKHIVARVVGRKGKQGVLIAEWPGRVGHARGIPAHP
mmetsp:Transcript_8008/g.17319  ORF Transcript_8008/g.17319 Transcript_8008/m.17319 type:complete len:245 (+) Transcript_8008:320-1054(+)